MILDRDAETSGIPGRVAVGVELKAYLIASLDLECVKVEVKDVVVAVALERLDVLCKKCLVVQVDRQSDAVRDRRIGVLVSELGVGARDIDLAVLGHDPLIDRIERCPGVDVILLHLKGFCLAGDIARFVAVHLGEQLGVAKGRSLEEPPAVRPLLNGIQILKHRVVVIARLDIDCLCRLDHDSELAGIPGEVAIAGDAEGELIAALYRKLFKIEIDDCVIAVAAADVNFLGVQDLIIQIDRQGHAVRPGRIGVFLPELDIRARHVDVAVFTDDPEVDRIFCRAGVDIVLFHFKGFSPA